MVTLTKRKKVGLISTIAIILSLFKIGGGSVGIGILMVATDFLTLQESNYESQYQTDSFFSERTNSSSITLPSQESSYDGQSEAIFKAQAEQIRIIDGLAYAAEIYACGFDNQCITQILEKHQTLPAIQEKVSQYITSQAQLYSQVLRSILSSSTHMTAVTGEITVSSVVNCHPQITPTPNNSAQEDVEKLRVTLNRTSLDLGSIRINGGQIVELTTLPEIFPSAMDKGQRTDVVDESIESALRQIQVAAKNFAFLALSQRNDQCGDDNEVVNQYNWDNAKISINPMQANQIFTETLEQQYRLEVVVPTKIIGKSALHVDMSFKVVP